MNRFYINIFLPLLILASGALAVWTVGVIPDPPPPQFTQVIIESAGKYYMTDLIDQGGEWYVVGENGELRGTITKVFPSGNIIQVKHEQTGLYQPISRMENNPFQSE